MTGAADTVGISVLDPAVQNCPFGAYAALRDEAPVYFDARSGLWILTRYEDFCAVAQDPETFSSNSVTARRRAAIVGARQARLDRMYAERGWPKTRALGHLDRPEHTEMRSLFQRAFRASQIAAYDETIKGIAESLVDGFAPDGTCDAVSQFAALMPVRVLCVLIGAPEEAFEMIRATAQATAALLDLTLPEEREVECVEREIAAQHFFKGMIDRLRARPDGTVLSDFVNLSLPSGRLLSDAEILMHLMFDLFFAGGETAAHAIANGTMLLCQDPTLCRAVDTRRGKTLKAFIEETLRLESPLRSISRLTRRAVMLHGVTIPEGALVMLRVGAANRDPRHFACPDQVDLERPNLLTHVAFGAGSHSCIGQSLARREMHWAFTALLDRAETLRLDDGQPAGRLPSVFFRALPELRIRFTPKGAPTHAT